MTATLAPVSAVPTTFASATTVRTRETAQLTLSIRPTEYHQTVDAGVIAVDIRSQQSRDRDGVLSGAIAVDASVVLESLTPGTTQSLRIASPSARYVLVSDDGHDAEWLAWHLQARGVFGARFVVGGFRGLRASRIRGRIAEAELETISAHAVD